MIRPFIFSVCIGSFIVWLNLLCFVDMSEAESIPLTPNANGQFDCWGIVMKFAKTIIKTLRTCTKEVKQNSTNMKEMSEKLGCVMKCVLHRQKFVNDDFLVSDETLSAFIHRLFPSEGMVNHLIKLIRTETVHKKHPAMLQYQILFWPNQNVSMLYTISATKLDPFENTCSSYGKFAVCMQSDMGDILNNPEFCIPKAKDKEFSFG